MEIKKAIEFISILRFVKGENEIKIEGHMSNEEKNKLIEDLLKAGWQPFEKIV